MNQLLPIIRRVRRPLLERDTPPMVVGNVEPPKVDAETLKAPEPEKTEANNATDTSNASAE